MSVQDEVGKGRLQGLIALRDYLAEELDEGVKQPAQVAKELRGVLAEIESLSKPKKKASVVDELAKRRRAKGGQPSRKSG